MTTLCFSPSGISISLHNVDLWQKFYPINEMVVTKYGRKLFPDLLVKIQGLDPKELYTVSLYLERVGKHTYTFTKDENSGTSQWEVAGFASKNNTPIDKKPHNHGGRNGAHWMENPVSFSHIYITHDPNLANKNKMAILVESMHKYQPVITVKKLSDGIEEEFRLTMTEFIVVTAYKNPKIIDLKTENNKFARAFCPDRKHSARGGKRSATVTSSVGSINSSAAKKKGSVSQGYQNQMMTPPAMTPPYTGSKNLQNQMMTTPPTMAMTPSTAPSTMTPPAMTMTTPPSQGSMYHQNQMMTPPTMQIPPSMFPTPMTPSTMTPPSMGSYNFQNPITNPLAMAMTTPPSQGSINYQNPYMTPPTMATPPAYNYSMNQNLNPYGPWNMPQTPMTPMPPGNMPQNNNYNGGDMSFLHGSTAANFDFRFQ